MMPVEVIAYQRICPTCNAKFYICRSCERGDRYCSIVCRDEARRKNRRKSSATYQATARGRANHQKRQITYRKNRQLEESVTHQSSSSEKKTVITRRPRKLYFPVRFDRNRSRACCLICKCEVDRVYNFF